VAGNEVMAVNRLTAAAACVSKKIENRRGGGGVAAFGGCNG